MQRASRRAASATLQALISGSKQHANCGDWTALSQPDLRAAAGRTIAALADANSCSLLGYQATPDTSLPTLPAAHERSTPSHAGPAVWPKATPASSSWPSLRQPHQLARTLSPATFPSGLGFSQHVTVRHKGTTHLDEAAMAAGLSRAAVTEEVLTKVKDHGLLHTAGLIGGKWTETSSDKGTFEVRNPATGSLLATMPRMRADETRAAIAAAHAVLPQWRHMPARERAAFLRRWHDLILQHKADIATLMTLECGKPTAEAMAEIASGAASVDWFAGEAVRVCGDVLEPPMRDRRLVVIKQPVGVVGAITPWNFPMSMITRKVAPALAAGCTVVLKPAELTPLTAVALAELAERAGLPDGCLNIVMGDAPAIGHELVHSDTVRKIGFTGSTAVGRQLAAGAGLHVKRVSLELGGNAPIIVFGDADLELAAKGIVGSALRNAGQTCICANRVFVHDSVYDKLAEAVAALTRKLRVGDGLDPTTNVGPLITKAALEKVAGHVADAVSKGGKVLAGGGRAEMAGALVGGNFFAPTVIAEASIDMRCFKEETFGPLIPLFRFKADEEAVLLANTTEYGLAAYFYTKDLARAWRVAEELEFGMIGLNEVGITNEVAPFGGVKASGLGREQSKYGLAEFQDVKYICMGVGYAGAGGPGAPGSA